MYQFNIIYYYYYLNLLLKKYYFRSVLFYKFIFKFFFSQFEFTIIYGFSLYLYLPIYLSLSHLIYAQISSIQNKLNLKLQLIINISLFTRFVEKTKSNEETGWIIIERQINMAWESIRRTSASCNRFKCLVVLFVLFIAYLCSI
jgi:hypothetical protein